MKKYIKLIPVLLYPYLYLIPLVLFLFTDAVNIIASFWMSLDSSIVRIIVGLLAGIIGVVILTLPMFIAILNTIFCAQGKYTTAEAVKMNLIIKCVHIPAYIFHFLLGCLGVVMSVWGIGFIFVAIVVDALTITTSGTNAIGCSVRMYKDGYLTKSGAILFGIANYIYCIDVVAAIYYHVKVKASSPKNKAV